MASSAAWVASLLKSWGVPPAGDRGTSLQAFPNPYSLVVKGGLQVADVAGLGHLAPGLGLQGAAEQVS